MTTDLDEPRSDLVSHLDELRTRVLRSLLYLCLTSIAVGVFFNPIYTFVAAPILEGVRASGGHLTMRGVMEGMMVRLWVSVLGGVILALPFIYFEVWSFVRPGLTKHERHIIRPLAPVSSLLFLAGVAMAYLITGPSVRWLLLLRPPDTEMYLTLNDTLVLFLKFYVAFGLAFQLPIVVVILAAVGVVNSRLLTRYWREATVLIFVVAAIITPTWDPLTMTVAALPMVLLYLGTIAVIKVMERRRQRQVAAEQGLRAGD